MGAIFKPCFEIRRYEDLSKKRKVLCDFSPLCMYKDKEELNCLCPGDGNGTYRVKLNLKKLSQMTNERSINAEKVHQITDQETCLDGIEAD